jgi:hypothetical protein
MSAEPQDLEVIERPQDLNLPPETETVFAHLTKHGAEVFSQEITRALLQAQDKGNLRPVKDVVEAWYRTLLLWSQPGYDEAVKWARRYDPRKGIPAESVVDQLGR